jgi:hypothetical protein
MVFEPPPLVSPPPPPVLLLLSLLPQALITSAASSNPTVESAIRARRALVLLVIPVPPWARALSTPRPTGRLSICMTISCVLNVSRTFLARVTAA